MLWDYGLYKYFIKGINIRRQNLMSTDIRLSDSDVLTLSNLDLRLSSASTTNHELLSQFSTCCHNSRLVADEDALMWFKNEGNYHVLVNQFHGNFHSKTPGCRILIHC